MRSSDDVFVIDQNIMQEIVSEPGNGSRDTGLKLRQISAACRVQTLACIKASGRGWLGASFSAMEIMTVLYHCGFVQNPLLPPVRRSALILSKGHAAFGLYAVLNSLGIITPEELLHCNTLAGLPAHCDRTVSGVDSDSGSLGQGLSKGIGIAAMHRRMNAKNNVYVILGDGELQEGQVFESLLSLRNLNLTRCIPIIDRNHLQSDSRTADIKDASDWKKVLEGIGLEVFTVDGHDPEALKALLNQLRDHSSPSTVIAETFKGGGSDFTRMAWNTQRREGIWHAKIPDNDTYIAMLNKLCEEISNPNLSKAFTEWRKSQFDRPGKNLEISQIVAEKNSEKMTAKSTMEGFAEALTDAASEFQNFYVLDADLEKPCRLTQFACRYPERYFEIGISEQDAASIGSGIGLTGNIAVVNTFASFYKRCTDQVFAAAAERLPVIFAGHYAGLDYFTDGKSHQALNDIALMRSIPNLEIYEPLSDIESGQIFRFLLKRMTEEIASGRPSNPAYIRLHKMPARFTYIKKELNGKESNVHTLPPFIPGIHYRFRCVGERISTSYYDEKRGLCIDGLGLAYPWRRPKVVNTIFAASPQMLSTALDAQRILDEKEIFTDVVGVSCYFVSPSPPAEPNHTNETTSSDKYVERVFSIRNICEQSNLVFSLESHLRTGGLADFIAEAGKKPPVRIGARSLSGSALTMAEMLAYHKISAEEVAAIVEKAVSCRHKA